MIVRIAQHEFLTFVLVTAKADLKKAQESEICELTNWLSTYWMWKESSIQTRIINEAK